MILPSALISACRLASDRPALRIPRRNFVYDVLLPMGALSAVPVEAAAREKISIVRKKLLLSGDWERAEITDSVAFGNGFAGTNSWKSALVVFPGAIECWHSKIEYDDLCASYFFEFRLQVSRQVDSREVAAMFRYRWKNRLGVFAAAFPFPLLEPVLVDSIDVPLPRLHRDVVPVHGPIGPG